MSNPTSRKHHAAHPAARPAAQAEPALVNVRRRQSRSVQTRQKILDAAKAELLRVGFDNCSTRGIAERAAIPHQLVLYHFSNKAGLWKAVVQEIVATSHEVLTKAIEPLEHVDDVAALRAFQRAFIELSASHPEYHWLLSNDYDPANELSAQIVELGADDIDRFIALIGRVQAAGKYIEGDPRYVHYLFVGAATRVFMLSSGVKRAVGISPFERDFIEYHIRACEKLFFRGLENE